ncbi:MAG: YlzJ-like family protein [Bacillota bacterium]|nr:YlzJ-like family protein [Bacillota bacterium]
MIWSVIAEEVIFADLGQKPQPLRQMSYLGRQMLVRDDDKGGAEIVMLLSSAPADYIDPRLSPGRRIQYR